MNTTDAKTNRFKHFSKATLREPGRFFPAWWSSADFAAGQAAGCRFWGALDSGGQTLCLCARERDVAAAL